MTRCAARRHTARPGRTTAFSMLELVLVIAIMGILAAIASPRYGLAIARYRAETAAQRIVNDLNETRDRAWSTGTNQTVIFTPASDSYVIVGMAPLDGQAGDYTVDLTEEPYGASLMSATFGGDSTVIFNGYGVCDSDGTIVVQVGDYQYTIVLNAEIGTASIQ